MSEKQLMEMIETASTVTERYFSKHGQVRGLYHIVMGNGENVLLPKPPGNKDASAALMRAIFEKTHTERYVYIDEAWYVEVSNAEMSDELLQRVGRAGLSEDPRRREAILFTAEDHERQITARREIVRDANGARLGPLVVDKPNMVSEGRMVGMLRPAGRMQ